MVNHWNHRNRSHYRLSRQGSVSQKQFDPAATQDPNLIPSPVPSSSPVPSPRQNTIAPAPAPKPSTVSISKTTIKVISPNGGESVKANSEQVGKVALDNVVTGDIALSLVDQNGQTQFNLGSFHAGVSSGTQNIVITIPTNKFGEKYKVYAVLSTLTANKDCIPGAIGCSKTPTVLSSDYSDNYFTVVSQY